MIGSSRLTPTPRLAISTIFTVSGFASAGWIARIPAVKAKMDMDTAQLGLLLLFIAVGSLFAFQIIGRLIEHWGSQRATTVFTVLYLVALMALALSPTAVVLAASLLFYGFGFGAMDVAMNAQGVTVEKHIRRPIMGSLHGYFSLGALIGAGISALLASVGVGLEVNLVLFAIIGLAFTIWSIAGLIDDEPIEETAKSSSGGRFSLPPRALWGLGVIAFCAAVGEGSLADWGALYVHEELESSEGMAAFGFTIFSTTMLIGRFATDVLTVRFGAARLVRFGAIVSALGLGIGLIPGTTVAAIVGFAVMGIGLASMFPIVYSAAGSIPGIPSGRGVAAVATIGYTGFLAGPPILGLLARATSIQMALLVVVALIAVIPFFANHLRRPTSHVVSQTAGAAEA